jgi:hypothetical protein
MSDLVLNDPARPAVLDNAPVADIVTVDRSSWTDHHERRRRCWRSASRRMPTLGELPPSNQSLSRRVRMVVLRGQG